MLRNSEVRSPRTGQKARLLQIDLGPSGPVVEPALSSAWKHLSAFFIRQTEMNGQNLAAFQRGVPIAISDELEDR